MCPSIKTNEYKNSISTNIFHHKKTGIAGIRKVLAQYIYKEYISLVSCILGKLDGLALLVKDPIQCQSGYRKNQPICHPPYPSFHLSPNRRPLWALHLTVHLLPPLQKVGLTGLSEPVKSINW